MMRGHDTDLDQTDQKPVFFKRMSGALSAIAGQSISVRSGRIFRLSALLVILLGLAAALGFIRTEQRVSRTADLTEFAFLIAKTDQLIHESKDNIGAYRARGFDVEIIDLSISQARETISLASQLEAAAMSVDPAYITAIEDIQTGLQGIEQRLIDIKNAPRDLVEQESFLGPRYDEIDVVIRKIQALGDNASQRVEEVSTTGVWEIQLLIVVMVVIAILALALVLVGQKFIAKHILLPISHISDVSLKLAEGETGQDIPETERGDEIGDMARSLSMLQERSVKLIDVQQEIATKATAELQAQKDLQQERTNQARTLQMLADKFEQTVGNVANEVSQATRQLQSAATVMADNTQRSSDESKLAAARLKEASSGVTGAAAASDEFMMSINEISNKAKVSAERARSANDVAERANHTILALDETASHVGGIAEMISNIAKRTNMLALNAAIEAARSGEAGKGFAVVASEVKDLAEQTSRATEEIDQQIKAIQNSSSAGVGALKEIVGEINELESTALSIATAVDQQSAAGQDMGYSIDIAAQNTEAVSHNVHLVSEMSVKTGDTAQQVVNSANQLDKQADLLRHQAGEFLKNVRSA